ncbi:MAG: ABC transporter ATP-binding protein [Armatimonadetes bacterium]|nr:ABC transporter ATP-binding protein [Armatimonadota bacterium]
MNRSGSALAPFLKHLGRHKLAIFLAVVCSFAVTAFNLTVPLLFRRLTEDVLVDPAPTQLRLARLGGVIGLLSCALLLRRVCQSLASYLATSVTQRLAVDVRRDVYRHLHRLRLEFFDDQRTGILVSNVTNDVTALQFLLHDGLVQLFTAPITVLGAIVLVFGIDPLLGLVTLAVFPVLYLVISRTRDRLRRINEENQTTLSHLTSLFLEAVWNIRIVRAFRRQDHEIGRFETINDASLRLRLQNARLNVLIEFFTEATILLGFAAVLWMMGLRVATGRIGIGDLIALVAYLQTIRSSLTSLSLAYTRYQQASGAGRRLLDLLHEQPLPPPPAATGFQPPVWRGELRLVDLRFAYPDGTVVFDGANAELRPGEKVALLGESGVGKSTLASLVLGLYQPQDGRIELDGVDVGTIPPEVLLEVVSIVPQDVGLFSGTVRDNIAYARLDASDEEIIAAAEAANAHGFITRLSEGYGTYVGDQGVKLSGGQKQRLAIARAILRNPRLLILDEATSHIDPETEALVQEALLRLMADRTTLIIAHQSSALRGIDRTLVLRQGRLYEEMPPAMVLPGG